MRYEVILRYHENDGIWGLCHENAVGVFNAFWSADGIFHDVFEHYFEGMHPHFRGEAMHTIYGEMAASGAAIAFLDIGIHSFQYRLHSNGRNYIIDTQSYLEEWISDGYEAFPMGKELCKVPRQQGEPGSYNFGSWLSEYQYHFEKWKEEGYDRIKELRFSDVRNCYIWGYKRANKILGDRDHDRLVLQDFLDQWYQITRHKPEYLAIDGSDYGLRGFRFVVNSLPELRVKSWVLDDTGKQFSLDALISY